MAKWGLPQVERGKIEVHALILQVCYRCSRLAVATR
jgi:hypothetical protein